MDGQSECFGQKLSVRLGKRMMMMAAISISIPAYSYHQCALFDTLIWDVVHHSQGTSPYRRREYRQESFPRWFAADDGVSIGEGINRSKTIKV